MSYAGISIREALDRINAQNGGWYLPQEQRQYVWGARHQSENYICLLLDSLLKRYPIGGIVLWETDAKIPYRKFIEDYAPGEHARQVDEGRWEAHKSLVYDGQQRLQTLYSVLRHRFNDRVLHFDLLFDKNKAEADETGFLFLDEAAPRSPRFLRMTELSIKSPRSMEGKISIENHATPAASGDYKLEVLIKTNISSLWSVFVDTEIKSIAYFSVESTTKVEVNEVFRRLNTGGIALTQLELVLSKIKAVHSDYEERLWKLSEKIEKESGGVKFPDSSILQFFHLMIKGTLRIDENRLNEADIAMFEKALDEESTKPLLEVFSEYLNNLYKINNADIIPRWLAVLPIASYLSARKYGGHKWRIRELPEDEVRAINQYFLLSQFCDWNTQTMVNGFAQLAINAAKVGNVFPLEKIRELAIEKNRPGDLSENQMLGACWFALKVLTPGQSYVFVGPKPQVDHIFPLSLEGDNENYRRAVDKLWNFQPMPASVNNYKRARHPKEFFSSVDGGKYWSSYNFIPAAGSEIWDDPYKFIEYRRNAMLIELERLYGIVLSKNTSLP
ncbi:MAG TPA: DUF262 domain-containing protein [Chiayiivirga sp.]|nr:DUF262 domain-containing protein [Chiayiivirga sp.]